jgi:hypothetical protein
MPLRSMIFEGTRAIRKNQWIQITDKVQEKKNSDIILVDCETFYYSAHTCP